VTTSLAAAYSATGAAWQRGPGRIYDRLAELVVTWSPVPIDGASALDIGAGTGAATRALVAAGAASVVAVDSAPGMLAHDAGARPPAAVADALALPFGDGTFDVVVAAFCLNHLTDPAAGLREASRVIRPGGAVVASAYAADDTHPVKAAVEGALLACGWTPQPWYVSVREDAIPRLATVDACMRVAAAARVDVEVESVRVPFPDLHAADLIAWRLGMAQHAPFVTALSETARAELAADAEARLGGSWPVLERSVVVIRTRPQH
jgi:SAM-dependent methyltransferase